MNKILKLISRLIICAVLVLFLGAMIYAVATRESAVAHAEELTQDSAEIVQNDAEPEISVNAPTFFGRIGEWAFDNQTQILTVVGDVILVGFFVWQKVKSKKKLVELGTNIATVKDNVENTVSSQNSVVKVTNELIEGYNKFEQALNNFDTTENERYKTMLAAFAQTKAILEILTTVYANSKNIPQGVKDLVNLKYADVLKLVGNEDKLKEIVELTDTQGAEEVSDKTEG